MRSAQQARPLGTRSTLAESARRLAGRGSRSQLDDRTNRRARSLGPAEVARLSILILRLSDACGRGGREAYRNRHYWRPISHDLAAAPAPRARAWDDSGRVGPRVARPDRRGAACLADWVPGALRLEGVAPFGTPVFILVADGQRGTLLLSRDRRVVRDEAPEEILNALIGLRLGADDLRALLSGCVKAAAEPSAARTYGSDWMAVDLSSGGTIYLNHAGTAWRIVAGRYGGLEVDYPAFEGDRPSQITLRGTDLNLGLA